MEKKVNRYLRERARDNVARQLHLLGDSSSDSEQSPFNKELCSDSEQASDGQDINMLQEETVREENHDDLDMNPGMHLHEDEQAGEVELLEGNPQPAENFVEADVQDLSDFPSIASDNDDSSLSSGNESGVEDNNIPPEEIPDYMLYNLRQWAVSGVSKKKVDELLHVLHPIFPYLPQSSKGLLHTPRNTETQILQNGELWHKGIKRNLDLLVTEEYIQKFGKIDIDIGIDGIPLAKSSANGFWVIMGRLVGEPNNPFIISVWYGDGKPVNVDEYLDPFCSEVIELSEHGYAFNGQNYEFDVRHYILDAVARSYIKCIHGHNSEKACEKCTVTGYKYLHREVFTDFDCPLRTDESFVAREDPAHHSGISPIEARLHHQMVSKFRLDGMHLVHLGVFKRFLKQLFAEKGARKLHRNVVNELSDILTQLVKNIPVEFARKPRGFKYFCRFKATEFRQLLLYTGVLVFQVLPQNLYKNFLLLHSFIFILTSASLTHLYDQAKDIARAFVQHAIAVFGRQFCTYNVHSLVHLTDECRDHGPLESFSAYPFENLLQLTKNILKSYYKPLQQLANRDAERDGILIEKRGDPVEEYVLSGQYVDGDGETKFKKLQFKAGFTLSLNEADHCFSTSNGDIVVLQTISKTRRGVIVLHGHKFAKLEDFYTYPLSSSTLGIFKVSKLITNLRFTCQSTDVANKCILLPCNVIQRAEDVSSSDDSGPVRPPAPASFLCIPLLHSSMN